MASKSELSFKEYAKLTSESSRLIKFSFAILVIIFAYYFLDVFKIILISPENRLLIWLVILLLLIPSATVLSILGIDGSKIGSWYKFFSRVINIDNVDAKLNYRSIVLKFNELFILADKSKNLIFARFSDKRLIKYLDNKTKSITSLFKVSKLYCESVSHQISGRLKIKRCHGTAKIFSPTDMKWIRGHVEIIVVDNAKNVLFALREKLMKDLLNMVFDAFAMDRITLKQLLK